MVEGSRMRLYLLDLLSGVEAQEVETALLNETKEAVNETISAAEEDLVSDYIHDRLRGEQKDRFLTHFLASPDRRDLLDERIWLRETLTAVYPDAPPLREPWLREMLHKIGPVLAERLRELVVLRVRPAHSLGMMPSQSIWLMIVQVHADSVAIKLEGEACVSASDALEVFRFAPEEHYLIGTVTISQVKDGQAMGQYKGSPAAAIGDRVRTRRRS